MDHTTARSRVDTIDPGPERRVLKGLIDQASISQATREAIVKRAVSLVKDVRRKRPPSFMEAMLSEYGLSNGEGRALMMLAEALLRVPDAPTVDALLADKLVPGAWGEHVGNAESPAVNMISFALARAGDVLGADQSTLFARMAKHMGVPLIRIAVTRAMRELGSQFVLGRTIEEAIARGEDQRQGFTAYSYDMLGEAALSKADGERYLGAYRHAVNVLAGHCDADDVRDNPGISIKLSALHPRFEARQKRRVMDELVPAVAELATMAKRAGMGLNVDAEEASRLSLTLDVAEAVLESAELAGWDGFGFVVQAYGLRCGAVIDWLDCLAQRLNRKITVRLVKGAYWDTEIKRAQVQGLAGFPVFTSKWATDAAYVCCAAKLLKGSDHIYPQFATHNAHSMAVVLELANGRPFEFQLLHGMGKPLHDLVRRQHNTRHRIYAPVGDHRELLAYLVRRLLENGANSSFVNQILDHSIPARKMVADPFDGLAHRPQPSAPAIVAPRDLFGDERINSRGWDLDSESDARDFEAARAPFRKCTWEASPEGAALFASGERCEVRNPADPDDHVGACISADTADVERAITTARPWSDTSALERKAVLHAASSLFEANAGEFFAVLAREAGKTAVDAVAELREAVDFLRYYGAQAPGLKGSAPRGLMGCISPWNFPLAIFVGQIAGALAAGNSVIAKPAEATPITASIAIRLLYASGVPKSALQFLPGKGSLVGAAIASHPEVRGIGFTGSIETARRINKTMAHSLDPSAPLIAETGGLNAMIVDSTALPEQAVTDIIQSAFRSAGQRCSALRILYLQEDVAPAMLELLCGAMDELAIGDPWDLSTDIGPVISRATKADIDAYVRGASRRGRLMKRLEAPHRGSFVAPSVIEVSGVGDLEKEVFGPVLHVATFKSGELDHVLDEINASGFGLTFGLHSRIEGRADHIAARLKTGNTYVNRNQIGAVVGSQPFGGEGLSGTGPKAGGPNYVQRLRRGECVLRPVQKGRPADLGRVQRAIDRVHRPLRALLYTMAMPGPTGERNRYSVFPRGTVLCLGPTADDAQEQEEKVCSQGCSPVLVAPGVRESPNSIDGHLDRGSLEHLKRIDAVVLWSEETDLSAVRQSLANRQGCLIPLISERYFEPLLWLERHVCFDTTAAGGDASLLSGTALQ